MFGPELTVRVVGSTEARIELVMVRPETTYCVRTSRGADPTYRTAMTGRPRRRALTAIGTCVEPSRRRRNYSGRSR